MRKSMRKNMAVQIAAGAERRAPSRPDRIQLHLAGTVPGAPNNTRTAKAGFDFGHAKVILSV